VGTTTVHKKRISGHRRSRGSYHLPNYENERNGWGPKKEAGCLRPTRTLSPQTQREKSGFKSQQNTNQSEGKVQRLGKPVCDQRKEESGHQIGEQQKKGRITRINCGNNATKQKNGGEKKDKK